MLDTVAKITNIISHFDGLNSYEIANMLYHFQCFGRIGDKKRCPLAIYFRRRVRGIDLRVDYTAIRTSGESIALSDNLITFIKHFDCGRHSFLDKERDTYE